MSTKKIIKGFIKSALMKTDLGRRTFLARDICRKKRNLGILGKNEKCDFLNIMKCARLYTGENSGIAVAAMFDDVSASIGENDVFFYFLDENSTWRHELPLYGNVTIDYSLLLNGSLRDLRLDGDSDFAQKNRCFIDALIRYLERTAQKIDYSSNPEKGEISAALRAIVDAPAGSFFAAIQRVLFVNQILWQTGHSLNGLGSLDMLLAPFYRRDIEKGIIDDDEAFRLVKEFCRVLHCHYEFKSSCLLGDTGQIILLGATKEDGTYDSNELTKMFLIAIKELALPDPKLLLKVNQNTPDELLRMALECIATGIGSPLLANDNRIIPAMVSFGYEKNDALHYGVAACWEPLVPGKVSDVSNMGTLNYVFPLMKLLQSDKTWSDFNALFADYRGELGKYILNLIHEVSSFKCNEDVVMSTFMSTCLEREKDISEGGALYNNIGFTGVGMGNTINSLLNIRKFIFDEKKWSFDELRAALRDDFKGFVEMQKVLANHASQYGRDEGDVISLTRELTEFLCKAIEKEKTPLGGKYKFGLSAPSYVNAGNEMGATPDGRLAKQPFSPHISCEDGIPYTELVQFAGNLDYTRNRLNGNVVDFIVSPSFMQKHMEKFVLFLKQSIKIGFFEMQMNVVDSKVLIAAKENPEEFPNLIVRVWGFSAYFKDLPEEYKNVLIQRAIQAEKGHE